MGKVFAKTIVSARFKYCNVSSDCINGKNLKKLLKLLVIKCCAKELKKQSFIFNKFGDL